MSETNITNPDGWVIFKSYDPLLELNPNAYNVAFSKDGGHVRLGSHVMDLAGVAQVEFVQGKYVLEYRFTGAHASSSIRLKRTSFDLLTFLNSMVDKLTGVPETFVDLNPASTAGYGIEQEEQDVVRVAGLLEVLSRPAFLSLEESEPTTYMRVGRQQMHDCLEGLIEDKQTFEDGSAIVPNVIPPV
jgi:hypothetical protein